jgi:hypothetical protein
MSTRERIKWLSELKVGDIVRRKGCAWIVTDVSNPVPYPTSFCVIGTQQIVYVNLPNALQLAEINFKGDGHLPRRWYTNWIYEIERPDSEELELFKELSQRVKCQSKP